MNFRKSSKRPLTPRPPLIFGKLCCKFFLKFMTEVSSIMAKICNINFWIENDPPPPFETFLRFHLFRRRQRFLMLHCHDIRKKPWQLIKEFLRLNWSGSYLDRHGRHGHWASSVGKLDIKDSAKFPPLGPLPRSSGVLLYWTTFAIIVPLSLKVLGFIFCFDIWTESVT